MLALWLYAGEAQAQFRVTIYSTASDKLEFYTYEQPDSRRIRVSVVSSPGGTISYECSVRRPGEAPVFAACTRDGQSYVNNLDVQHGFNEVQVRALANGTPSDPLIRTWYVRREVDAPYPQNEINGEAMALPNAANGDCNPLTIPIYIGGRNTTLNYRVNGGTTVTRGLEIRPNASSTPPYWAEYDLQPEGTTSLAAGQTLQLSIWVMDGWGLTMNPAMEWVVRCPLNAVAVLGGGLPPATSYSSLATFSFSSQGTGTPSMFCRLDGAPFRLCTSPHTYEGLSAGEHLFQVYAGASEAGPMDEGDIVEHRWEIIPPGTRLLQTPSNSRATTAEFTFEALGEGFQVEPSFECSVDGGNFFECNSPQTLSELSVGQHSLAVRALSDVGAGEPVSHSWEVLASEQQGQGQQGQGQQGQSDAELTADDGGGCSGCSTTGSLPLLALAGLWFMSRRRS